MNKRTQVVLTLESWNMVEAITREVNENFDGGSVNFSDTINEMILNSKIDVKALQLKHTDLKKSLLALAKNPEVDVETVLKCISELKGKNLRKKASSLQSEVI